MYRERERGAVAEGHRAQAPEACLRPPGAQVLGAGRHRLRVVMIMIMIMIIVIMITTTTTATTSMYCCY